MLAHRYWPYSEASVRSALSAAAGAKVRFGSFHARYLPPGCVAENTVFERENSSEPLIRVERLTIESSFTGLLRRHVRLIRAQGLHAAFTREDLSPKGFTSGPTTIDRFLAENSAVRIVARVPEYSLEFRFQSFSLARANGGASFSAHFENPLPRGMVEISGRVGVWNSRDPADTTVSGRYRLEEADLGVFPGIGGLASSQGEFKGNFQHLAIEGSVKVPTFELSATEHRQPLESRFNAVVNAVTGDTFLEQVKARWGRDEIDAHGSIARTQSGRRAAILDFHCEHGRIEDTFYPFIHGPRSPLAGGVAFNMHVVLPSGPEPFLKKLTLQSNFHMQDATFTHAETQSRVAKVGEAPSQPEPTVALLSFDGTVEVGKGMAYFRNLSVEDGGASAWFHGSYGLINEQVDLHGTLKTEASLSKTTHGIKSVFAKALEPFFKKRPHENVVPVKIGGTYGHPNFGLDMKRSM
ncbi:MAG: hypothetical protein JOZ14_11340 [Acidobacteria bacterium]|nr:hypothetical protein [Acidobacteriota bacterium]